MIFEWDEEKNKKNISKHKISFEKASHVFNDDCRLEIIDESHSEYENRYITIGLIEEIVSVVTVVYTPRNEVIRIISARKATNEERRQYYDSKKGY